MEAKRALCTPTMRMSGRKARATVAMPDSKPPPPTATTRVSMSGCACNISSATVPCPAMTSASSKGWTKTRPWSAATSIARSWASSKVCPCSSTSAPNPRVRSTFTVGVSSGMTITARSPRRCAWWASPWAWLPAEAAITPLTGWPVANRRTSLFSAPRSLKEAVNCRFSNFRKTRAPRIWPRVRLSRHGVANTWPARRAAAACTSCRVRG